MARRASSRPGRRPPLGQHFLRDTAVRDAIVAALPNDGLPLLEIGPGRGALTEALAATRAAPRSRRTRRRPG